MASRRKFMKTLGVVAAMVPVARISGSAQPPSGAQQGNSSSEAKSTPKAETFEITPHHCSASSATL